MVTLIYLEYFMLWNGFVANLNFRAKNVKIAFLFLADFWYEKSKIDYKNYLNFRAKNVKNYVCIFLARKFKYILLIFSYVYLSHIRYGGSEKVRKGVKVMVCKIRKKVTSTARLPPQCLKVASKKSMTIWSCLFECNPFRVQSCSSALLSECTPFWVHSFSSALIFNCTP